MFISVPSNWCLIISANSSAISSWCFSSCWMRSINCGVVEVITDNVMSKLRGSSPSNGTQLKVTRRGRFLLASASISSNAERLCDVDDTFDSCSDFAVIFMFLIAAMAEENPIFLPSWSVKLRFSGHSSSHSAVAD